MISIVGLVPAGWSAVTTRSMSLITTCADSPPPRSTSNVAPSPEKVQSPLVRHNMVVFSNGERALQASAQFGAILAQFGAILAQLF